MSKSPIRRAQLIAPFGVGAMTVLKDGVSVITCGLDHWYQREAEETREDIDIAEFVFNEWRLERVLRVKEFRLPPDYRRPFRGSISNSNCNLTIPFLRFPEWHFCPHCHLLERVPLSHSGAFYCPECDQVKSRRHQMLQVPFVAMCDHGHIQDFPWREWVHKSAHPACNGKLRLIATGGASLAAQKVECSCKASRTLGRITDHDQSSSFLTEELDASGKQYPCEGRTVWLGPRASETCSRFLKGSLRSASNVYFAQVKSAIFLPQGKGKALEELIEALQRPPLSGAINLFRSMKHTPTPSDLRELYRPQLEKFKDQDIEDALDDVLGFSGETRSKNPEISEDLETAFRREEFDALRKARDEEQLMTSPIPAQEYGGAIGMCLESVVLVNKLRETRVLAGFTRIYPENDQTLQARKAMLRAEQLEAGKEWLPAYKVYGEGLLLVLRESRLREWERQWKEELEHRLAPLVENFTQAQLRRGLSFRPLSPRFVLIHTLAHVLMNQLTFECGYSSASIRERLYVSDDEKHPMAGLLIYTAAGDAEGTMGGLVRMGKPGYLEPVMQKALARAKWCSADPVCMEQGKRGGQGPDSCNLAACHNCALVPETACEEFNRFLDRALLVGTFDSNLGYFPDELPAC